MVRKTEENIHVADLQKPWHKETQWAVDPYKKSSPMVQPQPTNDDDCYGYDDDNNDDYRQWN